jgi:methylamine dehydrogenase heavy chain
MKASLRVLAAAALCLAPAFALPQSQAVPQAEQMDVATLRPQYPHRLFTTMIGPFGGTGIEILDGDNLTVEGSVPQEEGALALDPEGRAFYVCETIWTLGNRGTRQDMVTVYDSRTLNLTSEILLPGRLLGGRTHNCDISASGKFLYVYNMQPASSIIVVDLAQRRVASVIELPGCSGAFPLRDEGFASLCGDGSIAMVDLTPDGRSKRLSHSARFFHPDDDPIFDQSLVDRDSGRAIFLSYTGLIYPVQIGEHPTIEKPWSLQAAAGLPVAGTGVQELAWRPGGGGLIAWNKAKNRLYVLMHMGTHWTQQDAGTEAWVVDATSHTLIKRLQMSEPMRGIAVSQDQAPLLYVTSEKGDLHTLDAETGQQKGTRTARGSSITWVPGF